MYRYLSIFFILSILLFLPGCATQLKRTLNDPEQFKAASHIKYLKVHMRDGGLYIFDKWVNDTIQESISGTGKYYDYKRNLLSTKSASNSTLKSKQSNTKESSFGNEQSDINKDVYEICWDDITLLETNEMTGSAGNLAGILIPGVPLSILATICATNPKACFGSCPTFYTMHNEDWKLVAEGFSSSILPTFEAEDVDMLFPTQHASRQFQVKVTNEALETHAIRYANLQIFPKVKNQRVYRTSANTFFTLHHLHSPIATDDFVDNSLEKLSAIDYNERYTFTDPDNLAQKESITYRFQKPAVSCGLVISARHTLLSTFLYYQGMAYSGNYAGYFAAQVENGNKKIKKRIEKLWDKQGPIEVYVQLTSGKWKLLDSIDEMGPIATDTHLILLPKDTPEEVNIRLKMTKGLWRLDFLGIGELGIETTPVTLQPDGIQKAGKDDPVAFESILDTDSYLYTFPGDEYILQYTLPDDRPYDFFLQTKGYYLEWMRDEWLAEQSLKKAKLMFAFPGWYMRKSAKAYKAQEMDMENVFWNSRYVTR